MAIDYAALAAKHGGSTGDDDAPVEAAQDYAALAAKHGGAEHVDDATSAAPRAAPTPKPELSAGQEMEAQYGPSARTAPIFTGGSPWATAGPQITPADAADISVGAAKGAAGTAVGLGSIAHRIGEALGITDPAPEAFDAARAALKPVGNERPAAAVEQMAEFGAVPAAPAVEGAGALARLGIRAATQALPNAALANAQGASTGGTVATGVLSMIPVGAALEKAGGYLKGYAASTVRAAIKPTVAAMKRVAGASVEGVEAKAGALISFILENKIATADQARKIISDAGREIDAALMSHAGQATDAPQRAVRYLSALEQSAARQGLPSADVATIRNAAAEVLESGLGKDVVRMVEAPHPTLIGADGKPITVLTPETTRALRTDVSPAEALERARATSKWDTAKAWGEQKGATTEASKATERALRDSVKAAVPEVAPLLRRQGNAIQAKNALERSEFQAANRGHGPDLKEAAVAGAELATGHVPVLAVAAHLLRTNAIKTGFMADALGSALQRGNAQETAWLLTKLGIAISPRMLRAGESDAAAGSAALPAP